MTSAIIILAILVSVMFILIWFLTVKLIDTCTMKDAYMDDYTDLNQKYEHLLVQVGEEGFVVDTIYRTAIYVKLKAKEHKSDAN